MLCLQAHHEITPLDYKKELQSMNDTFSMRQLQKERRGLKDNDICQYQQNKDSCQEQSNQFFSASQLGMIRQMFPKHAMPR
jgi:hypothetical protein